MDTDTAASIGRFIGGVIGLAIVVVFCAVSLHVCWNHCIPQVFDGREISLQQSFAMLGVAWTLSAVSRRS
jgi:hypothetical protein